MKTLITIASMLFLSACANTPSPDDLLLALATYGDACNNKDLVALKSIVSTDKINQRQRVLQRRGEKLNKDNFCFGPPLDELDKFERRTFKVQAGYARLILYRTISIPVDDQVYRSEVTYAFFKKERGRWMIHDYEVSHGWDPVAKLKLDEGHLDEQYQMKRHQYRFMEYDFPVIASISKEDLNKIISKVQDTSQVKIGSIHRATHPTDIEEPWIMNGQVMGVSHRTADPEADDVLIDVMTFQSSGPGSGHGESFHFAKTNGEWVMKSQGHWVE